MQHPPIKAPELRLRRPSLWERWTRKPGEAEAESEEAAGPAAKEHTERLADELYEEELPYTPMMEQAHEAPLRAEAEHDSYSPYRTS